MKHIRPIPFLFAVPLMAHAQPELRPEAFAPLAGDMVGELEYVDYGSGAVARIPATLRVEPLSERSWRITFGYPDEPQMLSVDTLVLSSDGRLLDDMEVMEVSDPLSVPVRIVLEEEGTDNDQPVRIRKTWTIGPNACTLQKEVRTADDPGFRHRNMYTFTR
ncbi:MAG: hypothetical protein WAU70_17990 [Flavobacteriales bacterium]